MRLTTDRFEYPVLLKADGDGFEVTCRGLHGDARSGHQQNPACAAVGVDEKEVRRLLDPHYGAKLPRIAEAIKLPGKGR